MTCLVCETHIYRLRDLDLTIGLDGQTHAVTELRLEYSLDERHDGETTVVTVTGMSLVVTADGLEPAARYVAAHRGISAGAHHLDSDLLRAALDELLRRGADPGVVEALESYCWSRAE